jgi:hypothetical protein
MTFNLFKAAAGLAWAAAVVATAVPADAVAVTSQYGEYASCAPVYAADGGGICLSMDSGKVNTYYRQQIKFVTTACSAGGCSPQPGTVYTDFVYSTGRKAAWAQDFCGTRNVYGLDTCAC